MGKRAGKGEREKGRERGYHARNKDRHCISTTLSVLGLNGSEKIIQDDWCVGQGARMRRREIQKTRGLLGKVG